MKNERTENPVDLLCRAIKAAVDEFMLHPKELKVGGESVSSMHLVSIVCHRGDLGRVIGQRGETFRAIDSLARLWGMRHKFFVKVTPAKDSGGRVDRYDKFT